jgi:hypothetical protein
MAHTNTAPSSKTIGEFCQDERISKSVYYDMKRRGIGPVELVIPGTKVIRITHEAQANWRQRMAQLSKGRAMRLETERRRKQTTQAGKIAAASPLHVSKRVAHKRQRRQRAP